MSFLELALPNLVAVAIAMVAVWLVSLALRDASVVDIFWGAGFAMIAALGYVRADGHHARRALVAALTIVWGTRLAVHLLLRNWSRGEDYRYADMRERWGQRFPLVSLFTVFAFQGLVLWTVSLPVQAAQLSRRPDSLTWVDALGVALWTVGFLFEVVGDEQLRRFKTDPSSSGRVMDRGLWRYTRHPNYFGDATLWWGLGVIAVAAGTWWTLVGPAIMTFALLRVSGVAHIEKNLRKTKPEYEEYIRRTSAFFPLPPKKG